METADRSMGSDRPRVCLLTETFHPEIGGGESQARLLAGRLRDRGWNIKIVTRRSVGRTAVRERVDGIEVHRVPPTGHGRFRKWALIATAYPTLMRLRSDWDLIYVSGFRILGVPAIRAARRLGRPCVLKADSNGEMSGEYFRAGLESVGLSPSARPVRSLIAARNRQLRNADAFVAISATIERELSVAGVASERVVRIPNGVDTERFSPAGSADRARLRRQLGLPAEGLIVVYTGRLVRYKGLPPLLDAWKRICRDRENTWLVLVGSGGSDIHDCEAELRDRAEGPGLQGRVFFTGAVDDVHRYLRASDVFAFPTEEEAFGISLVEAMACGLPCVATRVGAIPEIAGDGEALLVSAEEPAALEEGLRRLLDQPELRVRVGRAARAKARSFSADVMASSYEELFIRHDRGRRGASAPGP